MQPLSFWPEAIVVTNRIPAGRLHPGLQRDQPGLVSFSCHLFSLYVILIRLAAGNGGCHGKVFYL